MRRRIFKCDYLCSKSFSLLDTRAWILGKWFRSLNTTYHIPIYNIKPSYFFLSCRVDEKHALWTYNSNDNLPLQQISCSLIISLNFLPDTILPEREHSLIFLGYWIFVIRDEKLSWGVILIKIQTSWSEKKVCQLASSASVWRLRSDNKGVLIIWNCQ